MPLEALSNLIDQLPALRAEHDRIGKLIAAIEEFTGGGGAPEGDKDATDTPRVRQPHGPRTATVRPDEFVGMSTAQAIRKFLEIKGRGNPQGPREMAEAMIAGGRGDTDSRLAYDNVNSALKRMKKNDQVRQVRRGEWGLASWYGVAPVKKANGTDD